MVLSTEEQRQWQAFDARRPVFVVKNPYAGAFAPSSSVNRIETSANRILFVGRLIREKGIFELVEAFAEVIHETNCELIIVGEGPKEDELRRRIHRLRIGEHVSIVGYLTGSDLENQYRQATIFVLPSWDEGFPTVLSEAMDEGLPIVTTHIRGAADHLVAGENALFVEPGDVNALATAIETLLADNDLRSRMAKANRDRVRIFEPRVVASEYLGLLESLIRERSEVRRRASP
jgi:glycosyltransferase involved in cell wall biosynthesis